MVASSLGSSTLSPWQTHQGHECVALCYVISLCPPPRSRQPRYRLHPLPKTGLRSSPAAWFCIPGVGSGRAVPQDPSPGQREGRELPAAHPWCRSIPEGS